MNDERIAFKEVSPKCQTRLPDEVIEELDIDVDDENNNGVEFYQNSEEGEIILRGMDH